MTLGQLFADVMREMVDISADIEAWEDMLEEITMKSDRWLNFSLACAWLGFGLSIVAFAYLMYINKPRKECKHVKKR